MLVERAGVVKAFKLYEFLLLLFGSIFVLAGLILIGTAPIRAVFFLFCFIGQTMLGMTLWLKAKQEWNPDCLQLVAVGIPIGMISYMFMEVKKISLQHME